MPPIPVVGPPVAHRFSRLLAGRLVVSALIASTIELAGGRAAAQPAEEVTEEAPPALPPGDTPPSPVAPDEPAPLPPLAPPDVPAASTMQRDETSLPDADEEPPRPPPLAVEYIQTGVAMVGEVILTPGATCPDESDTPCILGSGGGLALRAGYRTAGPWYFGGAYQFLRSDTNLYRLPIFQQLLAEMRWHPELGTRLAPYINWGVGGLAYGNEWGAETGGALIFGGVGAEFEISRLAIIGFGLTYKPMLIAGFEDTAGQNREVGLAQFLGFQFQLEIRSELGRRGD